MAQTAQSDRAARADRRVRARRRLLKAAVYTLTVLLMFLLYGDPHLRLFGWKPNLMAALVGCVLLFEGPCMSVGLAAGCGLLTDLLRQTPFGVNGLVFCIVALLLWLAARFWLRPVPLNAFFASLILSAAVHTLDFLLVYGPGSGLFVRLYLGDLLSTAVFAFLFFRPVRFLHGKLKFAL